MEIFQKQPYLLLIQSNGLCCVYLQRNVPLSNVMFWLELLKKSKLIWIENMFQLLLGTNCRKMSSVLTCGNISCAGPLLTKDKNNIVSSYARFDCPWDTLKTGMLSSFANSKAFSLVISPPISSLRSC